MKTLKEWQQELDLPPIIELIDITYSNEVYRFISSFTAQSVPVMWDNNLYSPFPFKLENIGYTTNNGVDKSRLAVSSVSSEFSSILNALPDITGAVVRWILIFEEYLVTSALIQQHRLRVTRLQARNKNGVVYECDSMIDSRIMLPRRQMLREGTPNARFAGLGINWE